MSTADTTEINLPQEWMDLTQTQRDFLAAYIGCGSVTQAADAARCSRFTHYRSLRESENYRQIWEQVRAIAASQLVDTMLERAIHGQRRYKHRSDGTPITFPEDIPELGIKAGDPYYEAVYPEVTGIFLSKALAGLVDKQVVEQHRTEHKTLTVQVYLPGREQRELAERVPQDEPTTAPAIIEATGSRRTTD